MVNQKYNCRHKNIKIEFPFESVSCVRKTELSTTTKSATTTKTSDVNSFEMKIIKNDTIRAYLTKNREVVWHQETQKNCPLFRMYFLLY